MCQVVTSDGGRIWKLVWFFLLKYSLNCHYHEGRRVSDSDGDITRVFTMLSMWNGTVIKKADKNGSILT